MTFRWCLRLVAWVCIPALVPARSLSAQASPKPDSLALGRKWTRWLYQNQFDSIAAAYAPAARGHDPAVEVAGMAAELRTRAGTEVAVIDERFVKRNGRTQYWRTARFSNPVVGEPVMVRWAVNADWQIIGLGINPESAAPPTDPPR